MALAVIVSFPSVCIMCKFTAPRHLFSACMPVTCGDTVIAFLAVIVSHDSIKVVFVAECFCPNTVQSIFRWRLCKRSPAWSTRSVSVSKSAWQIRSTSEVVSFCMRVLYAWVGKAANAQVKHLFQHGACSCKETSISKLGVSLHGIHDYDSSSP